MARTLPTLTPTDLERRLLAKGVGDLVAGRDGCADCGRTPLTGELVHRYGDDRPVCELCRRRRRETPERTDRVRHPAPTVRLRRVA